VGWKDNINVDVRETDCKGEYIQMELAWNRSRL